VNLCCYHYLKYIANKVDILLCPYDYIVNPNTRKSMGLSIEGTTIVFDEAHNLETVAEDALTN
jgi:Rad3-related DNA helicase